MIWITIWAIVTLISLGMEQLLIIQSKEAVIALNLVKSDIFLNAARGWRNITTFFVKLLFSSIVIYMFIDMMK